MQDEATVDEDYYDLLARLGVPYFHWGGMRATDRLASLCGIDAGKRVLVVGCGTGYSACHIAEKYRCRVVGIDISKGMVERVRVRAEAQNISDRVAFCVADAHDLPFDDDGFDAVITEFVTIFLEKPRALGEYVRVLRPGGQVGVNELYKSEDVPRDAEELISEAEAGFEDVVGLPIVLPTLRRWDELFRDAGLEEIRQEEIDYTYGVREYAKAVGGWAETLKLILWSIHRMIFDRRMKNIFGQVGKMKDVFMKNKKTKQYVGAMLLVGQKP